MGADQRPRLAPVVGADRARPLVRAASLATARPADRVPDDRDGADRTGAVQGRARRMAATGGVAVLLTGVGKRYDIVAAFAQHARTVAADPNPLAPAQYAAHHRHSVPRIDDPGYVGALQELCERYGVGAVVPLTDLDLEVLAHARTAGRLPAFVPDPEIARA